MCGILLRGVWARIVCWGLRWVTVIRGRVRMVLRCRMLTCFRWRGMCRCLIVVCARLCGVRAGRVFLLFFRYFL